MMEVVSTSKSVVNLYHTTQRNISQGGHIHTRSHVNMECHLVNQCNWKFDWSKDKFILKIIQTLIFKLLLAEDVT
jgi:hypothetical protein